jgi:hypothetical protein
MQQLYCQCGQIVFCDNNHCENCGRLLAFDPLGGRVICLSEEGSGAWTDSEGLSYQLCNNRIQYGVCNGAVPATVNPAADAVCNTCALNRTIPITDRQQNLVRWRRLEQAKRRMISGVSSLGLDVGFTDRGATSGMRFNFMEDKRSHPDVLETFVSTGHKDGLITVNLMEADEIQRVQQRELMGERYRTLLGHFRHEAGHFFYPLLVVDEGGFADLFGDPNRDYNSALDGYYRSGPPADWGKSWISAYASSHPLEDWAECFAHYLHIQDALETASARGIGNGYSADEPIRDQLIQWSELALSLNELSRSLGQRDAYPFVVNAVVTSKLEFVQRSIAAIKST